MMSQQGGECNRHPKMSELRKDNPINGLVKGLHRLTWGAPAPRHRPTASGAENMADTPQDAPDRAQDEARLRALEAKLAALTPKPTGPSPMGKYEQANLAWRMVIELVAGLGLGFVIGYGLDYLLGTTPLLMVVFIFLGLAAGIKSLMRTASELDRKSGDRPESDERD